jgi:hypothetical protein
MAANRKNLRAALQTWLQGQVTSAQAVHKNEPGDIGGASPVLVISSRGSRRGRFTFQGSALGGKLWLDVYTLAAESSTGTYTYADSADVLDDLEAQIAGAFEKAQENGIWNTLNYDGESTIDFGVWDSRPYFRERIPIVAEVFG